MRLPSLGERVQYAGGGGDYYINSNNTKNNDDINSNWNRYLMYFGITLPTP